MATFTSENEFIRSCFKTLLQDGEPHRLKEIAAYVSRRANTDAYLGTQGSRRVWQAIVKLTHQPDSDYINVSHGAYQLREQAMTEVSREAYRLDRVLDRAVELEGLLADAFERASARPDMTEAERGNLAVMSKSAAAGIEAVIDDIAAWRAVMEDHGFEPTLEEPEMGGMA